MNGLSSKRSMKAGLPPGSLVHIGERRTDSVKITVFEYGEDHCDEFVNEDLETIASPKSESAVRWIKVEGIHNVDTMAKIGEIFDIHPLTIEDILNTDQRPKMEDFDNYTFIVAKIICRLDDEVITEQLSIILRPSLVISFHETQSDIFVPLTERIRGKGRIRKMGADYLAYGLLDAVVDNYFLLLEEIGEKIGALEEEITATPGKTTMQSIHDTRRELVQLRRAVWPLRDVMNMLALGETPLVSESTKLYFKDVYDHAVQSADTVEIYRETMTEMLTVYLTSVSNRLNEVMKILTVITTIFMPLTLIAGIYGMNFEHMPELHWAWGYPLVLLLMVAISLSMLRFFRKKRWI
ncbi:MAG: magnesium/cobalt transporter CorA [Desulfobacteraceae bacterium]|nr:magnesium/cobalt transporter CorA [Desulfobacteraceae bacterium]